MATTRTVLALDGKVHLTYEAKVTGIGDAESLCGKHTNLIDIPERATCQTCIQISQQNQGG